MSREKSQLETVCVLLLPLCIKFCISSKRSQSTDRNSMYYEFVLFLFQGFLNFLADEFLNIPTKYFHSLTGIFAVTFF